MTRRYLFDTGIAQDFQEDRGDVRARATSKDADLSYIAGLAVENWAI